MSCGACVLLKYRHISARRRRRVRDTQFRKDLLYCREAKEHRSQELPINPHYCIIYTPLKVISKAEASIFSHFMSFLFLDLVRTYLTSTSQSLVRLVATLSGFLTILYYYLLWLLKIYDFSEVQRELGTHVLVSHPSTDRSQ